MNDDREPPNDQPLSPSTTNTDSAWETEFSVSDSSDDQLDVEGTDTESQYDEETDMEEGEIIEDDEDTVMDDDTDFEDDRYDDHEFEENVPDGCDIYLSAPLDYERRIDPGPAPENPEEYEISSITQIADPETGVFPHPEETETNERNSHALAHAMIRVSHWPGESSLTMAIYNNRMNGRRTVCVSRYSVYKNMENRLIQERAKYKFDIGFWIEDRPALPGRCKHWLEKLKSLETRCDDRTWWSVQRMFNRQNYFPRCYLDYQWFNPEQFTVHRRTADEVYEDLLSPVRISSLSEDATACVICGDTFTHEGERPVRLPCMARHMIGDECARKWIKPGKEGSCPLCRGKFPVLPMVQWPWWVLAERRLRELEAEWQQGPHQITVDPLSMNERFAWIIRLFWHQGMERYKEEVYNAMPYQLGTPGSELYIDAYENETGIARETVRATLFAMNGLTVDKHELLNKLRQDFEEALLRDTSPMFDHLEQPPVPPGFRQYLARVLHLLVDMRPEDLEELEEMG